MAKDRSHKPGNTCHYRDCTKVRPKNWTTCPRHHTAGMSIVQWNRIHKKGK